MRIFALADLHLATAPELDKPMDTFGPRWIDHVRRIATAWSALVREEDVVLIPGDISWAMYLDEALPDLRFLDDLPGSKILMRGNHDFWWGTLHKLAGAARDAGLGSLRFLQNNALPLGEHHVVAGSRLWLWPDDPRFRQADRQILEHERLRLEQSLAAARPYQEEGRELLVMTHFPPCGKDLQSTDFTRRIREAGAVQAVFGHIHRENSPYGIRHQMIDAVPYSLVAADHLRFVPLLLAEEQPQKGSTSQCLEV